MTLELPAWFHGTAAKIAGSIFQGAAVKRSWMREQSMPRQDAQARKPRLRSPRSYTTAFFQKIKQGT